ncbi:TcfC E-set like domain-containing protein [Vibrio jasicida]|uniref:TcfC E-set like domain-containing protein n=1 Tax=Vibrio jasicida TaxID=766224 RepID=UPI000CE37DE2|nr:TcfC E-set like domain-containing protein [Vibrio jasicida]
MVLIRKHLYRCILLSLAVTQNVQAQYVPEEFKHFYDFEENKIMFLLPNDSAYESEGFSNYYGVDSVSDEAGLRDAILNSGIKEKYVEEVINAITSGRDVDNRDGVTTDFSFEEKTVSVQVPAIYLDEERRELRYTSIEPDAQALIVGNHFFASYYGEDTSTTLNTDMTLGLGNGYISSDLTLSGGSNQDAELDGNAVFYEHNLNSVALRIGYDAYDVEKNNSTSNMDYSNSKDNYYLSVSSSDNLFISDDEQSKKVYFDIKGSGTVDVVRDGRTIYTQSFLKGQHGISYKHLPRGNYNVELVIRADGYPEERIARRINNNVAQTSHQGYDYNVTLRESTYDSGEGSNNRIEKQLVYGDVSFTKALFHDSVMVGVNSQTDGEDFGFGVLANYVGDWVDVGAYYNDIDDGRFFNSSLSVAGFSLDYQDYDGSDKHSATEISPLLRAVYGSESFDQTTLSYSLPILDSNISFYGSRVRYDGTGNSSGFESQNLALNYNTTIFRDMQLNLGFSRTLNDNANQSTDVDDIYSASVTIPLGDNHTTYSSGIDSSSRTGQRLVNSLLYDKDEIELIDGVDTSANASINNYIDGRQSEVSLNGRINMSNDKFNSSAYANVSNNSNTNLSFNAESTSIITKDDIYQTKENSQSYVIVESEARGFNSNKDDKDFGVLDTQVNSGYHTSTPIDSETRVVGLNEFSTYKFQVDSEISGYKSSKSNHDVKSEMFTYPGSVHKVSNKVEPIVTFLSYFEDFNNKPLNDVKCIGDGCVSVGRVGDGIYSISLVKDKPFKVASDGEFCFIEPEDVGSNGVMTKCFPKIETLDNGMQLVSSGLGTQEDRIYYLGVLEGALPDSLLSESRDAQIEYIQYNFANNVHLFAKSEAALTDDESFYIVNKQVFDDIQNYVRNIDETDFFAKNR